MVDFRVFSKEVVPYVAADLMCPREESPRSSYGTIMNWLKAKKKKKKNLKHYSGCCVKSRLEGATVEQ